MRHPTIFTFLLIAVVLSGLVIELVGPTDALSASEPQNRGIEHGNVGPNPLDALTTSFPGSVKLKENGHLLEFCPDNTCDGFVSSSDVSVASLKDFAYLYTFFFSEYIYLPDWRTHENAKSAAEYILSEPEYHDCKSESDSQAARCVLLHLSRNGRIKLIFVRYDENRRNVVSEDISRALSKKPASPQ